MNELNMIISEMYNKKCKDCTNEEIYVALLHYTKNKLKEKFLSFNKNCCGYLYNIA